MFVFSAYGGIRTGIKMTVPTFNLLIYLCNYWVTLQYFVTLKSIHINSLQRGFFAGKTYPLFGSQNNQKWVNFIAIVLWLIWASTRTTPGKGWIVCGTTVTRLLYWAIWLFYSRWNILCTDLLLSVAILPDCQALTWHFYYCDKVKQHPSTF